MKQLLQNTLNVLRPRERKKMMLLALADVVISILDIAMLAMLVLFINFYTQSSAQLTLPLSGMLNRENALNGLLILLSLFIIKNLAAYLLHRTKYRFVYNVAARISSNNLLQYLEGNYHDYAVKDSSVHIRRISQQPVEFCHYVLAGFQQLFSESIIILLTIVAILAYDAMLFLLLCLVLLPPLIILSIYIRKKLSAVRSNIKTSSEHALQHLKEGLAGYIESNIYDTHDFFIARYGSRQQTLNRYLAALQSAQVLPNRFMEVFAVLGLLGLIAFNEAVGEYPYVSMVALGAFLAAAYKIIPGLVKILNTASQVRTYAFTVTDLLPVEQKKKAASLHAGELSQIVFRNVAFSYADKNVLKHINLELQKGELTGLQGLSGRGKTTLINLLLGFLQQDEGDILFNGRQTSETERQAFRKNISYVKQQPFLLHDTVLTNITLSNNGVDEQQLQYALKASGLDNLTMQWPEGLNKMITENGKNISGGQRQRIALARALYKNADLLLLDEPFNELDEAASQAMMQALRCLAQKGKMVLLITHDTKSLSFCTKIISLDAA